MARGPQDEADELQADVDAKNARQNAEIEREIRERIENIRRQNERAAPDPRGSALSGLARGFQAGGNLAQRWARLKEARGASSLALPLTDEAGFAGAFDDGAALIPSSKRIKRDKRRVNPKAALRLIETGLAPGLEPLPARAADRSRRARRRSP